MFRLTPSNADISRSVKSEVSALASGTSPVSLAAKTTLLPVLAVAARSPTKTASALGGISEISAAEKPLFKILINSEGEASAAIFSASSKTCVTAPKARSENCAAAGRSSL